MHEARDLNSTGHYISFNYFLKGNSVISLKGFTPSIVVWSSQLFFISELSGKKL